MSVYRCCDCGKEYSKPSAYAGHRSWCSKSVSEISKRNRAGGLVNARKAAIIQNTKKRIKLELQCLNCGNNFELLLRESEIKSKKYRKHCSRACANSRNHSAKTKQKTSKTLSSGYASGRLVATPKAAKFVDWSCKNCGKQEKRKLSDNHKTCGKECARQLSSKQMIERIRSGKHSQRSTRCVYHFRGKLISCDSKIEYAGLDFFEKNYDVVAINRCDIGISYNDFDEKIRRFIPDFFIDTLQGRIIVECKNHAIGKTLNEKWRLYKELIPFKQAALKEYAAEQGIQSVWFTPNMHKKFYCSLFGKDLS